MDFLLISINFFHFISQNFLLVNNFLIPLILLTQAQGVKLPCSPKHNIFRLADNSEEWRVCKLKCNHNIGLS